MYHSATYSSQCTLFSTVYPIPHVIPYLPQYNKFAALYPMYHSITSFHSISDSHTLPLSATLAISHNDWRVSQRFISV